MKIKRRDIGIDLISETPEEKAVLHRFWEGGIFSVGYSASGLMILSFGDLIEREGGRQPVYIDINIYKYLYDLVIKDFLSRATDENIQNFKVQFLGYRWKEHKNQEFKQILDQEICSYYEDTCGARRYTENVVDLKLQATVFNLYQFMKDMKMNGELALDDAIGNVRRQCQ